MVTIKRLCIAAAAFAAIAISTAAYAHLEYSATIVYYSDSTYSQVVGTQQQFCSGPQAVHGIETDFQIETNIKSCGSSGFECPGSGPCF